MQVEGLAKEKTSDGGLRVPAGNASSLPAKCLFRLCAAVRWWNRSSHTRVAEELCNFPSRIVATWRCNPTVGGRGYVFPRPDKTTDVLEFLQSCSEDIRALREENSWMTSLDQGMAAEAWARGLQFALRSLNKETL